jgi:hypothetical protein
MNQNATFQAICQNPIPTVLQSTVLWQVAGTKQLRISGVEEKMNSRTSVPRVVTIVFKSSRIYLVDGYFAVLAELPDDALTQIGFWQDQGGNLHFWRWNPQSRWPTTVVEPWEMVKALKTSRQELEAEGLVADSLDRSYMPISVQVRSPELLTWLKRVSRARAQEFTRRLEKIAKTGAPSRNLPLAA